MPIYTKKGDKGRTEILGGKRVCKCCVEMEAIGEIDELNAVIGIAKGFLKNSKLRGIKNVVQMLEEIQNDLFVIGSNIAGAQTGLAGVPKLDSKKVLTLEKWIDEMDNDLPELSHFILPGGDLASAQIFFARAVCRRAERRIIKMEEKYKLDQEIKKYINRLSDYLFVLGRWVNIRSGEKELKWD